MIHNCKGLKEHNLILVEEKGIVNAYSKYYNLKEISPHFSERVTM